eukprot:5241756-Alexandrium_andersonii.AAC.1
MNGEGCTSFEAAPCASSPGATAPQAHPKSASGTMHRRRSRKGSEAQYAASMFHAGCALPPFRCASLFNAL